MTDPIGERVNLPEQRIQRGLPISVEFQPNSFPRQTFEVTMEWNSSADAYSFEVHHQNRKKRVTKGMATPYRFYSYLPWIIFVFIDSSGEVTRITPDTLASDIHLFCAPGPSGQPRPEW